MAVSLAVALAPLARLARRAAGARAVFGACGLCAAALATLAYTWPEPPHTRSDEVQVSRQNGYISSAACRSCHPSEYASWHDSYHRSMTQAATESTVRAPWSGALEWRGNRYELFRKAGELWASLPDPDRSPRSAAARGNVERRVTMTTGSHHYQAYWVAGARGNELWQFPFVYHFESARFIPRHDAFLQPEESPPHTPRWNANCVQCHSVAGQPAHDLATDRFETRAAELGIACEACHGPGAEHAQRHRSPLERYRAMNDEGGDDTIVNPARLAPERASEVCAQCHSYFVPRRADDWWQTGFVESYRPGAALDASRLVLDYERDRDSQLVSDSLDSAFYTDGTVRVGGREWNGLSRSACFERGTGSRRISCLSCHDLHGGTRDDQLNSDRGSAAACAGCHAAQVSAGPGHSHHAAGSSGSECVNCHMPYTTYALFKSIRSHRITEPRVRRGAVGAAPNACNLCHQDQSLDWTARWLETWYPGSGLVQDAPSDGADARAEELEASGAAAAGLLAGDAATRVVFADLARWPPARAASGSAFQAELLIEALGDPYAAVRFVAERSLRAFPGFEGVEYDFIAAPSARLAMRDAARARLTAAPSRAEPSPSLARLTALRDDRPIRISE